MKRGPQARQVNDSMHDLDAAVLPVRQLLADSLKFVRMLLAVIETHRFQFTTLSQQVERQACRIHATAQANHRQTTVGGQASRINGHVAFPRFFAVNAMLAKVDRGPFSIASHAIRTVRRRSLSKVVPAWPSHFGSGTVEGRSTGLRFARSRRDSVPLSGFVRRPSWLS